jgi:hypothetical protein
MNTPAVPTSNLPATVSDAPDGLEDMDESDSSTPICKAAPDDGGYLDPLTGLVFSEFDAILLGLVKGRTAWPPEMQSDGEGPICRSYDHDHGIPDLAKFIGKYDGETPLAVSGFDMATAQEAADGDSEGLDCANCGMAKWDSHPRNKSPWCAEQYSIPFLRIDGDNRFPGILVFQRTALKSLKAYLNSFRASKDPTYTALTRVKAVVNSRGTVRWVTPGFTRIGATDPTEWPYFSQTLAGVRRFLTTPRGRSEEETGLVTPVATPAPTPKPKPPVEPEPVAESEEITDAEVIEQDIPEAAATATPPKRVAPAAAAPAAPAAPVVPSAPVAPTAPTADEDEEELF